MMFSNKLFRNERQIEPFSRNRASTWWGYTLIYPLPCALWRPKIITVRSSVKNAIIRWPGRHQSPPRSWPNILDAPGCLRRPFRALMVNCFLWINQDDSTASFFATKLRFVSRNFRSAALFVAFVLAKTVLRRKLKEMLWYKISCPRKVSIQGSYKKLGHLILVLQFFFTRCIFKCLINVDIHLPRRHKDNYRTGNNKTMAEKCQKVEINFISDTRHSYCAISPSGHDLRTKLS